MRDDKEIRRIAVLWLHRMLAPFIGKTTFVERQGFADDDVAEFLGLQRWLGEDAKPFVPAQVRAAIRRRHRTAERGAASARVPQLLRDNVRRLGEIVPLTADDERLLELALVWHIEPALSDALFVIRPRLQLETVAILSRMLDMPEEAVGRAVSQEGVLIRAGILSVEGIASLKFVTPALANQMLQPGFDPAKALSEIVRPASAPTLTLQDYPHLRDQVELLQLYLPAVLVQRRRGVNVFIYGPPGTGKSELARALAVAVDAPLYELALADATGELKNALGRLRSLCSAQAFLAGGRSLLIFEEAEDVFSDADLDGGEAARHKAFVNQMLETNPVPTLWVSNSVSCLDPAFARRFDFVLEVPIPPAKVRYDTFKRICGGLVPDAVVRELAHAGSLAPAVVARAAEVVRAMGIPADDPRAGRALRQLVSNTLAAQRHGPLEEQLRGSRPPLPFDIAHVNCDADLEQVVNSLAGEPTARICLWGPPGTGKTSFGHWLAQRLGRPLRCHNASEILGSFVGETEANLARIFEQARKDRVVLLLDEVDSFLRERGRAQHSWEVTAVNEFLTQMERYDGLLIASTNLMRDLDKASLRRFDLKLKFDYLGPAQLVPLLHAQCDALGLLPPSSADEHAASALSHATPGDFANVARQHRFRRFPSASALIAALASECALKGAPKGTIGF